MQQADRNGCKKFLLKIIWYEKQISAATKPNLRLRNY